MIYLLNGIEFLKEFLINWINKLLIYVVTIIIYIFIGQVV